MSQCYTDPVLSGGVSVANLTLSIEAELLQSAREVALRERTTVNAVVRDFLSRYVDARTRRLKALDALDDIASRNVSQSDGQPWSRESLHQR